jgi:hypothetical protein
MFPVQGVKRGEESRDVYVSYSLTEYNPISARDPSYGICLYVMNLISDNTKYEMAQSV